MFRISGAILLAVLCLQGCSSAPQFISTTPSAAVVVDGSDQDWSGRTTLVKDSKAAVGFQHDAGSLYLCFKTSDRALQMQVLTRGLTVWFDPKGGSEKLSGVRFPIGGAAAMRQRMQEAEGRIPREQETPPSDGRPPSDGQPPRDPRMREREIPTDTFTECEVIGPAAGDREIMPLRTSGLEARLSFTEGVLICEMRIPLEGGKRAPFMLAWPAGAQLSVGFETEKPQRGAQTRGERMSAAEGEGGERGGMEGGRGGMHGGMEGGRGGMQGGGMPGGGMSGGMPGGGMRGRMDGGQMQPLDMWVKLVRAGG